MNKHFVKIIVFNFIERKILYEFIIYFWKIKLRHWIKIFLITDYPINLT